MDKNRSHFLARFRGLIQAGAALLTNIHLPNFLKGTLYQGKGKYLCVPGLNCYSCPGAAGACPIGAFQAVVGSSKFRFSYYVTGILILLGVLLGRFICGFLCPFGWLQELLHKIPSPKLSTRRLKPLRYIKYAVLLIMVVLLPAVIVNASGMGDPFFCKYLCPQGVLEGAIPLSLTNAGIRAALGKLFSWKFCILLAVLTNFQRAGFECVFTVLVLLAVQNPQGVGLAENQKFAQAVEFVGAGSFWLYLAHPLVLELLPNTAMGGAAAWLCFAGVYAVCLMVCYALYTLFVRRYEQRFA